MVPHSDLSSRIAQRIQELVARARPRVSDPGLLVALSGGPDSVALLLGAHQWARNTGNPLEAAHLNHQLRGEAADQDALFCADLCAELDIPLHEHQEDVGTLAKRRGLGLEEAGRHARKGFLSGLLAGNAHLHLVAKGQHRNDQAETVIMRLFRGTGPDGLGGIRPVSGHEIHPLLEFSRPEVLAFLEAAGRTWRTDASNLEGDNVRARLRRELLPLVRDIFGEGCDLTPARLAEVLQGDLEYLDQMTAEALARLPRPADAPDTLNVPGLLDLPTAMAQRVLRAWLTRPGRVDPLRLEKIHLANILDWLRVGQSGTGLDLPGELVLRRSFDRLELTGAGADTPAATAADHRVLVRRTGPADDPVALGRREENGCRAGEDWNLTVPANVLQGNLRVRNPRPGDRFQPFGLDGNRKLSDLFRDLRLPEARRSRVLVVCDDLGILWIVGLARSERTRLLPTSDRIVTISVVKR